MSDLETAARPYAKAIFELANEGKSLDFWSEVLQLGALVAANEDVQAVIASPSILSAQQADIFISVMAGTKDGPEINQEVKNLVKLLSENDRLAAITDIAVAYEVLKQEAEGTVEVKVTSAKKLTAKQEKAMVASLKTRLGKEVSITAEIDESLIAGAIIRAGDLVIDGSARGRLNKLTSTLNK